MTPEAWKATQQVEVIVGSDRVIRINIDGICVARIRCSSTCEIKLTLPTSLVTTEDGSYVFK